MIKQAYAMPDTGGYFMYSGGRSIGMQAEACKRDLEADAKRLKKRIDELKSFSSAIAAFAHSGSFHVIEDHSDRKALYAIFGGLQMMIPSLEIEYDALLAEIEKGQ